jgi:hypothetical protein
MIVFNFFILNYITISQMKILVTSKAGYIRSKIYNL